MSTVAASTFHQHKSMEYMGLHTVPNAGQLVVRNFLFIWSHFLYGFSQINILIATAATADASPLAKSGHPSQTRKDKIASHDTHHAGAPSASARSSRTAAATPSELLEIVSRPVQSIDAKKYKIPSVDRRPKTLALLRDSLALFVADLRAGGNVGYAHLGLDAAYRRLVLMTNVRRHTVLALYASSCVLSAFLLYLSTVHCQMLAVTHCPASEKQNKIAKYINVIFPCIILLLSLCWFLANYYRVENSCLSNYNYLEMPTTVLCALLAGVCGVVEIHYNFDYSHIEFTRKWTLVATDAVALVLLHAGIAFALT